ncbi:hypothetical protein DL769_009718 [Monosporascus sp. CRB-8-3]|nr:hypothetical protein DL769_009718 [Monosporascus sp. CRB-8-3]
MSPPQPERPVPTDSSTDGAFTLDKIDVIEISETGKINCLDIDKIEAYLAVQPEPGKEVDKIFAVAASIQDHIESFDMWFSELVDLIADKNYWKGGYDSVRAWRKSYKDLMNVANRGKALRDKKREAINGIAKLGGSGARLAHLVRNSSRTFLEAVRAQMTMHSYSYPLVCSLANVKTFHRVMGTGSRGVQRTPETQTGDLSDLDKVVYRVLDDSELAAAKLEIGPSGFLVRRGSAQPAVADEAFDEAVASFVPGKSGLEQTSELAKVIHPAHDDDDDDDGDSDKGDRVDVKASRKNKNFVITDYTKFPFVTRCTCPDKVPKALTVGLEKLSPKCTYDDLATLIPQILDADKALCPRHCQIALVRGLGISVLRDSLDHETLLKEVSDSLRRLQLSVDESDNIKPSFDTFKQSRDFNWAKVNTIQLPKEGKKRKNASAAGANKKART